MTKFVFLISLFILTDCSGPQSQEMRSGQTYEAHDVLEKPICVDLTINGKLKLNNSESILNTLGDLYPKLNIPKNESPNIFLKNKTGSEYLKMSQWEGSGANYFSYFVVGHMTDRDVSTPIYETNFVKFKTECGIHLGLSRDSLLLIKGPLYKLQTLENNEVIIYTGDNLYQAKYYFKNKIIVKYEFGFTYP